MNNIINDVLNEDDEFYDSYDFQRAMKNNNSQLSCEDESESAHEMYLDAITITDGVRPLPVDVVAKYHVILD